METIIVYWGNIGIVENKMEATEGINQRPAREPEL